jgi:hypothetical protein
MQDSNGVVTPVSGFLSMTTSADPATNAAVSSTIVSTYAGVVITLTGAGNNQTLQTPSSTTAGRIFTVVNNDTSTNSVPVIANSVTYTVTPGEAQSFIWDGSAWGPIDIGITAIPVVVSQGGTGAVTLTDHGVLLGSGTAAITALGVLTNGQLLKGVTGGDPVATTLVLTEGTNTFNFTLGTASIDIAAGAAVDINANLTVSGVTNIVGALDVASGKTVNIDDDVTVSAELHVEAATHVNQDLTTDATPTFAGVNAIASGWQALTGFTATPPVTAIGTITFTFAASATVEASADCVAQGVKVGQFIYNSTDDARTAAKQIIAIAANKTTITLAASYAGTTGAAKEGSVFGEKLTMTTDYTASVKVGYPIKYTIGGTTYYGLVSAIASNLLTITGVALSGDVTALYYGDAKKVEQLVVTIPSTYEDADDHNLIVSDLKSSLIWSKSTAYLVAFSHYTDTADGSADGTASVEIADDECNLQANGFFLAAAKTWYPSGIAVDSSAYNVENGEAIEITAHKGTGGDGSDLTTKLIFVLP